MSTPTVAVRLRRRFIVLSRDAPLLERLQAAAPGGWEMVAVESLAAVGDFHDVLLHRFLLLDLDECDAFDPLEVMREIRVELMLNIPVICFGGDAPLRDAARLARADRFFDRDAIVAVLPQYCDQFGWGG